MKLAFTSERIISKNDHFKRWKSDRKPLKLAGRDGKSAQQN